MPRTASDTADTRYRVIEDALVSIGFILLIFFLSGLIAHAIYCSILPQEHRPTEPSCGECHYAIKGLEEWRCPECGSDLRQVGIILPKGRGQLRTTLLVGLIAWTALCASMVFTILLRTDGQVTGFLPTSIIWIAGATFIIRRRACNQRRIRVRVGRLASAYT